MCEKYNYIDYIEKDEHITRLMKFYLVSEIKLKFCDFHVFLYKFAFFL